MRAVRFHEYGLPKVADYTVNPVEEASSGVDVLPDTGSGEVMNQSWLLLKSGGITVELREGESR